MKAVHLLRHKLIQKTVDDFPVEGDTAKKRESITGLTKPPFWKVKTDRWRGAAYEDEQGQVWLVAAGRRYAGEGKDFYKRFMTDIERKGAPFFLPSEEDLHLYREEQDLQRLEERERQVQALAIGLLKCALSREERYATDDLVLRQDAEKPRVLAHVELMVEVPGADQPAAPHSILIEIRRWGCVSGLARARINLDHNATESTFSSVVPLVGCARLLSPCAYVLGVAEFVQHAARPTSNPH